MPETARTSVHTVATTIHGRYVVRSATAVRPSGVLVACHGYAQEAEAFASEVDSIPGVGAWLVVSIQALHRFYNRAGEVVGSWMTRQDRELAIVDNVAYVRAVLHRVVEDEGLADGVVPVVYLGFSQGVAMAFRAAAHVGGSDGVIALGGGVPPEIRGSASRIGPVLLSRGTLDEWYARDKFDADLAWLRATAQLDDVCEYEGGHVWTDAFRERAGRFLERVAEAARQRQRE